MNLLLVEPAELCADGTCTLDGRRALHLRTVLRARRGSTVRAGVIGGNIGTAEVLADDGVAITLRISLTASSPPPLAVDLVLALPRPKVITRTIEIAASFGLRRIDLTNAWRVDKSYLTSPRLDPGPLAAAALTGAEQGATTHVPTIAVHTRLMELLDDRFPAADDSLRIVAHPGAPPIEQVVTSRRAATLAIGPEGGWIERELDTLVARGFIPASLGTPILRTEAAVAAALAQLMLVDRLIGA